MVKSSRYPLILASKSKARADLLRNAGFSFSVLVSDSEDNAGYFTDPHEYCIERAMLKARCAAEGISRGVVVGADTVAFCNGRIIGKPDSPEHAIETLLELSSSPHEVITGLAVVVKPRGRILALSESTQVFMRQMSPDQVRDYVESGEAMGKAGSYAIQETGDKFVERLKGSASNVIGLPMELLHEVLEFLSNHGILLENCEG